MYKIIGVLNYFFQASLLKNKNWKVRLKNCYFLKKPDASQICSLFVFKIFKVGNCIVGKNRGHCFSIF